MVFTRKAYYAGKIVRRERRRQFWLRALGIGWIVFAICAASGSALGFALCIACLIIGDHMRRRYVNAPQPPYQSSASS